MDDREWLSERFEEQRPHLKAVAYRMLGSLAEAEDAVQEAWMHLSRAGTDGVENLGGWLTTIVARVSLNMLRSRTTRREEALDVYVPDPLISRENDVDPEHEAVLADSVGLALQVVLDTLAPAERLAFVLHDMFDVPFDEIAGMVGRSPDAARQLASRARRRVHGIAPEADADIPSQREVVNAFFAAARSGDFNALIAVLDPDVVLRSDGGQARPELTRLARGPEAVAHGALVGARGGGLLKPVLVNGSAGVVVLTNGQPFVIMGFTVRGGKIAEIDCLADPERLSRLDLSAIDGWPGLLPRG